MKKTIILFALILGIGGIVAAQTCGTGGYNDYGYGTNTSYGNNYSYNSNTRFLGTITSRWRGNFDRRRVVDSRMIKSGRNKVTMEYFFANGDVLEVQARRVSGYGNNRGNGRRNGNNYSFNSNASQLQGKFDIHYAHMNGRTIHVNYGTLTINRTNGRKVDTHLDMQLNRRESFNGSVRVLNF